MVKKGVYTIEAAVWISLLLFVFAAGIGAGMSLYTQSAQEAEQEADVYDGAKDFYRTQQRKGN